MRELLWQASFGLAIQSHYKLINGFGRITGRHDNEVFFFGDRHAYVKNIVAVTEHETHKR